MATATRHVVTSVRLVDPVGAVTGVSHDLSGGTPLKLRNGSSASALDLQWQYFTLAETYVGSSDLSPVYKAALSEWRGLL